MHAHHSVAVPTHVQNSPDSRPEMYPRQTDDGGRTVHSLLCLGTRTRRDWSCHRCCELMAAASKSGSANRAYFAARAGADEAKGSYRQSLLQKLRQVQRPLPLFAR